MYGVAGKVNVSLDNGKTTVTFVNVTANTKTDASGDALGTITGSIFQ
jgi:hypothetical protein